MGSPKLGRVTRNKTSPNSPGLVTPFSFGSHCAVCAAINVGYHCAVCAASMLDIIARSALHQWWISLRGLRFHPCWLSLRGLRCINVGYHCAVCAAINIEPCGERMLIVTKRKGGPNILADIAVRWCFFLQSEGHTRSFRHSHQKETKIKKHQIERNKSKNAKTNKLLFPVTVVFWQP